MSLTFGNDILRERPERAGTNMKHVLKIILAAGLLAACQSDGGAARVGGASKSVDMSKIDPDMTPEEARSYTNVWEDETTRHRSIMFPHVVDGCKRMIQSQRLLAATGFLVELEGPDCNCDLIIDGKEDVFIAPTGYKAERMTEICLAPGIDGATRQLEIMRESLKEDRDFSRMKNVEGF